MSDLRERLPAQSLMQKTLQLHKPSFYTPSGDALSWYKGALGEIAVAGVLAWLGSDWTVLHSVPVGSSETDIDHVVIGRPGVFTINTKAHPGQDIWIGGRGLFVSGQKRNYIRSAAAEAARAEQLLSKASGLVVPVIPIIVLVNPGKRTVKAAPEGGVRVVADWELLSAFDTRPVFSAEQMERIVSVAVKPETWHSQPAPEVNTRTLAIQFNAIVARGMNGAVPAPLAPSAPAPAPAVQRSTKHHAPAGRRKTTARQSRRTNALGKLIAIGLGLWFFYGAIVPAFAGMVHH